MSRLLTPQEVADRLAVSSRTVRRMAEAGDLPALRVGSLWRFDPERLNERLAEWQTARTKGNPNRERQASAQATATVARPEPLPIGRLPEGYVPVFGDLSARSSAARPAARRSGSAKAKNRPA